MLAQCESLAARVAAVEAQSRMAGSGSIKTAQDMLQVVRTLRNMTAGLEDRDRAREQREKEAEREKDREAAVEQRGREAVRGSTCDPPALLLQSWTERLGACEVEAQVHQVRLDALEDNACRFEHRQLKVNDAFSRHLKALLTAAG